MNAGISSIVPKLWCALVVLLTGVALGRIPSPPPDFASEEFWQSHDIVLARVTEVPSTQDDVQAFVLETVRCYTERPYPIERTLRPEALYFGTAKVSDIKKGDELLGWQAVGSRMMAVRKVASPAAKAALIKSLERISVLRAQITIKAAKECLFTADSLLTSYCVLRLAATRPDVADLACAKRLKAIRGDASEEMRVRLAANRIIPDYSDDRMVASGESRQWLRATLVVTSQNDAGGVLNLVAREVNRQFPDRRDRFAYYAEIIRDESTPLSVRTALVANVVDGGCFDFSNPSGTLESEVFTFVLSLLKATEGEMRISGATTPWAICHRIEDYKQRVLRSREALTAIEAALRTEREEKVRYFMTAYREHLSSLLVQTEPRRHPINRAE